MAKEEKKSDALGGIRGKIYEVIYEAETPAGKAFDVALLICICISLMVVCLDSVVSLSQKFGEHFWYIEWLITIIFSIEYILRIISIRYPFRYIFSFYGLVDLLSILPTYLALILTGTQSLLVIRAIRLLRIFRILKLQHYVHESAFILSALKSSWNKIFVFILTVQILIIIFGAIMYLVEGPKAGFTSIPQSMYWAVVTMTTVGYGDITPITSLGKFIASIIMVTGYGIVAVPTGIVTSEMNQARKRIVTSRTCPSCTEEGHLADSIYCRFCSGKL